MQLPVVDSAPKTRPKNEGVVLPSPLKQVEDVPSRLRQRTPPNLVRRSSFPPRMKHLGTDNHPAVGNAGRPENSNAHEGVSKVPNGYAAQLDREIIDEPQSQKAPGRASKEVQTNSSNSVSSSVSIQGFELCDDAATAFIDMTEETQPDHGKLTHAETSASYVSSSASQLHSRVLDNVSAEDHRSNNKSIIHPVKTPQSHADQQSIITGSEKLIPSPSANSPGDVCFCKNGNTPRSSIDSVLFSDVTPVSSGSDKFPLREFISSMAETVTTTAPLDQKAPQQDKGTVMQNFSVEKPTEAHLPSVFDDVIHVIRHSCFRVGSEQPVMESVEMGVQNVDVGKLLNVVRDDLEIKDATKPVSLQSMKTSEPVSLKSSTSEDTHVKEMDERIPVSCVPKSDSSVKEMDENNQLPSNTKSHSSVNQSDGSHNIPSDPNSQGLKKSPSSANNEDSLVKETLDVNSSRQRAEALEGLLELSAELLQQNRLEELAVVLKPFGKDKVSPRETAIWLARSLKGMMTEDIGRNS